MKSFLLVVVGIVIGAVASLLLAPMAVGVGAGVGILTGLKAGACLTVEAAKAEGLINAQQVDQILRAAGKQIASTGAADNEVGLTGSDAECAKVVADLKKAAQKN